MINIKTTEYNNEDLLLSQQSEKFRVVEIPIDDLGIDEFNVRKSPWDHNEDLIGSIKLNGIDQPLMVRSCDPSSGMKYSIISGSRRYNAAIDAGLKTVPCFINELNDFEAALKSFDENFNSERPPNWQFVLQLRTLADFLEASKAHTMEILKEKTGFTEATVQRYLAVSELPDEMIELLKEPKERTTEGQEILKKFNIDETRKSFPLDKAVLISKELKGVPVEKQMEVANKITSLTIKDATQVVNRVRTYPKASMEEITKTVLEIPKGGAIRCFYSAQTLQALDKAAVTLKMDIKTMIIFFVEKELKQKGFL